MVTSSADNDSTRQYQQLQSQRIIVNSFTFNWQNGLLREAFYSVRVLTLNWYLLSKKPAGPVGTLT